MSEAASVSGVGARPHVLITGTTGSGKTTLAKQLVADYRQRGVKSIVLDPMADPEWNADFITRDPEEFLHIVKNSFGCLGFIDEGGENAGIYNREMHMTATRGRHYGHSFNYLCQRPNQIAPTIRSCCEAVCAFRLHHDDALAISRDFTQEGLRAATSLQRGEYLYATNFQSPTKWRVF